MTIKHQVIRIDTSLNLSSKKKKKSRGLRFEVSESEVSKSEFRGVRSEFKGYEFS